MKPKQLEWVKRDSVCAGIVAQYVAHVPFGGYIIYERDDGTFEGLGPDAPLEKLKARAQAHFERTIEKCCEPDTTKAELIKTLEVIADWLVCSAITTAEDVMQAAPNMVEMIQNTFAKIKERET